jgi:hypothetical protein
LGLRREISAHYACSENGEVRCQSAVAREMRTVTVRMDAADLSRQMAAMREWLDRHRYEPTRFACDQDGNAVVVSVEFPNEREGEAFASHFDCQEPSGPPPFRS